MLKALLKLFGYCKIEGVIFDWTCEECGNCTYHNAIFDYCRKRKIEYCSTGTIACAYFDPGVGIHRKITIAKK